MTVVSWRASLHLLRRLQQAIDEMDIVAEGWLAKERRKKRVPIMRRRNCRLTEGQRDRWQLRSVATHKTNRAFKLTITENNGKHPAKEHVKVVKVIRSLVVRELKVD